MPSIKPVPALATLTTLLLTATTIGVAVAAGHSGARAARHDAGGHPRVARDCHASIDMAPRELTAGDPVVIFGGLTCGGGASVAGQTVVLFQHLPTGRGYGQVQSTTTDGGGFYEFPPIDGLSTESVWFVRADGASSHLVQALIAAGVTLNGPAEGSQLLTGSANAFTGTVNPNDAGYAVFLERHDSAAGGRWDPIGPTGQVGPEGGFTIPYAFPFPGSATIRAVVVNRAHTSPHNSPSASNMLDYEVSQAQKPGLTIQASADPIEAGQSLTLSGVVTAGAHKLLTLKAAIAHARPATVAKVTADGAGKYMFASLAPSASTVYRVRVGNTSSAALLVGVRDTLTAKVSQTTVQAGQPLTFSGTIAPDHTGHAIYLERRNASGTGFHVVQVAAVGSGSAYSIVHTIYDVGASVYRVAIPGGPENEGAASSPFAIAVTSAPAATLTPEAPGNSSQPFGNG